MKMLQCIGWGIHEIAINSNKDDGFTASLWPLNNGENLVISQKEWSNPKVDMGWNPRFNHPCGP